MPGQYFLFKQDQCMRRIFWTFFALFLSFSVQAVGTKVYPAPIVQLDDYFTHHVLVAEKSTHKLYLFQNENGYPKLVKTYAMATGKKAGDKIFQGDHRTPEGVYEFTQFLTHEDLIKRHGEKQGSIYGVGAFVMNYPNPMDSRERKTGGGIWLHSTNDETRIEKGLDSRGCLVSANDHLIEISKYIELYKTKVIVVHNLNWMNETTWETRRQKITETVSKWRTAWETEQFKDYISHYHPSLFHNSKRGNLSEFRAYKRAVFNNPGQPVVEFLHTSVLAAEDYIKVTLMQNYQSNTINDLGRKIIYLKKDEFYNYKIVHESWNKDGIENVEADGPKMAFKPTLRFFKTMNSNQILHITGKKENN